MSDKPIFKNPHSTEAIRERWKKFFDEKNKEQENSIFKNPHSAEAIRERWKKFLDEKNKEQEKSANK